MLASLTRNLSPKLDAGLKFNRKIPDTNVLIGTSSQWAYNWHGEVNANHSIRSADSGFQEALKRLV